jgi:hypothetical protein
MSSIIVDYFKPLKSNSIYFYLWHTSICLYIGLETSTVLLLTKCYNQYILLSCCIIIYYIVYHPGIEFSPLLVQ